MRQNDPAAEIPKAAHFVKAEVETRNFHFEAYGASEREALEALRAGLTRHSEQYAVSAQWIDDCMESPRITAITVGTCYRDREALAGIELSSDHDSIAGGSQTRPKG